MGTGRKKGPGGGGAALNFKVVGGTSAPSNPKENTIWINTSTPINSWTFLATSPGTNVPEGRVWIKTGTASPARFNALKKNGLYVYPTTVFQFISGAWVAKSGKIYIGGVWKDLLQPLTIIPNTVTYGASAWTATESIKTKTVGSSKAVFSFQSGSSAARMVYVAVDVTYYNTLKIVGTLAVEGSGSSAVNLKVGLFNKAVSSFAIGYSKALTDGSTATINNTYDVSSLTGTLWFGFFHQVGSSSSFTSTCTLTSVELS